MTESTYRCTNTEFDPTGAVYESEAEFLAMCQECFGESPELREQGHDGVLHVWVGEKPIANGNGHWEAVLEPTRIHTIIIETDTPVAGYGIVYAGEYRVTMPSDYDPSIVSAEDIALDHGIELVE